MSLTNAPETSPQTKKSTGWVSWLVFIAVATALYFGNVELQSFLGKRALAKVGFPQLSLEQALSQAKAENKLVLADMSAIWCPSCRKLDSQVLADSKVKAEINKRFVFTRIEYESEAGKAFMSRYQVNAFPTLLILDAEGNKLRKLNITFDPAEFLHAIKRI